MILMALVGMFMLIFALLAGFATLAVLVAGASALGGMALAAVETALNAIARRRARHSNTAQAGEFEWARPTAMPEYAPCRGFEAPAPGPAYAGTWVFDPLNLEEPVLVDDAAVAAPSAALAAGILSREEPFADSLEDLDTYILIG